MSGTSMVHSASLRDLFALAKPRVTLMVVATYGAGAVSSRERVGSRVWLGLVGTTLVVAAANALNMWIERDTDARMARTRDRPLPSGRLSPAIALTFAALLAFASMPCLIAAGPALAPLGVLALTLYAGVYTPLKRRTLHALPIGAVAGAMPPLMGRVAVTGGFDREGLLLFALLFVWQMPHFHAISLVRGAEYEAAGLVVGVERRELRTRELVAWCWALLGVCLVAPLLGAFGWWAGAIGVACSLALLLAAVKSQPTPAGARPVFLGSMLHLAVVLFAFAVFGR